jgi:hypothetical protein
MIKLIFKIIGIILIIASFLITLYFFFGNGAAGIQIFKEIFSNGFLEGIKEFFSSIWNGFTTTIGLA